MKLFSFFAILSTVSAFAPVANVQKSTTALNAEQSRQAFISAAGAAIFGAAVAPAVAMDQELVTSPTEQWETGSPTSSAEKDRIARYTNARTQLTSNFAPIKRLNLERKSPVVSEPNVWNPEALYTCF